MERAIALREAICHIFSARVQDFQPTTNDLAALNAALDDALSHLHLAPGAAHFDWQWIDFFDTSRNHSRRWCDLNDQFWVSSGSIRT